MGTKYKNEYKITALTIYLFVHMEDIENVENVRFKQYSGIRIFQSDRIAHKSVRLLCSPQTNDRDPMVF